MVESCSVLKTVIIMWPRRGKISRRLRELRGWARYIFTQPRNSRNLRLIFPLRGQ